MTPEHQQRLRTLTPYQRDLADERAAIVHEACPGTTWAQADAQALAEVTDRGQRTLAGVR